MADTDRLTPRSICRTVGMLALGSLIWWASGMPPWWAPFGASDAEVLRAAVVTALHFAGIFALYISFDSSCWPKEDRNG